MNNDSILSLPSFTRFIQHKKEGQTHAFRKFLVDIPFRLKFPRSTGLVRFKKKKKYAGTTYQMHF